MQHLTSVLSYIFALFIAIFYGWSTQDLIWGFWLSSLLGGYGYMLYHLAFHSLDQRKPLANIARRLFLLAFFTVHFCLFHGGHALFISKFTGSALIDEASFSVASPFSVLRFALTEVLPLYGLFLLPVFARKLIPIAITRFKPADTRQTDTASSMSGVNRRENDSSSENKNRDLVSLMHKPYVSVVRMHIAIILLAFLSSLNVSPLLTYALVLALFFFVPDIAVKNKKAERKQI